MRILQALAEEAEAEQAQARDRAAFKMHDGLTGRPACGAATYNVLPSSKVRHRIKLSDSWQQMKSILLTRGRRIQESTTFLFGSTCD